jgi:hypothetical protein
MKSIIAKALILGFAAAATAAAGCSQGPSGSTAPSTGSAGDPAGEEGTGSVSAQLTVPGGLTIDHVDYTLSNGINLYQGTGKVGQQSLSIAVGNVRPGSGYTVTLTAPTTDGTVVCRGQSALFTVAGSTVTAVDVPLACTSTAEAGLVSIGGTLSSCVTVNKIVANPPTAPAGGQITLEGFAVAPGTPPLAYQWSASTGSFDNPTSAITTYTCPSAAGQVPILLTVTALGNGGFGDGSACSQVASTMAITVTCTDDGGAPPDAASDVFQFDAPSDASDASDVNPDSGGGPCTGNKVGLCTPTEVLLESHAQSCYECMFQAGCIDDDVFGDVNNECEDLPGTWNSGPQAGASKDSLCLSLASCILSTGCAGTPAGIANCYCGPAAVGSACASAGTNVNGACLAQELAGFPFPLGDNTDILKNFDDTTTPSGKANQIFTCAIANGCSSCTH